MESHEVDRVLGLLYTACRELYEQLGPTHDPATNLARENIAAPLRQACQVLQQNNIGVPYPR